MKTFNVAFGLSDRHDSPNAVEDEDYGVMLPFIMSRNPQGNYTYQMLDAKPCTSDYFSKNMFPSQPKFNKTIEFNVRKMKCIDMHNMPVHFSGDFNTDGSVMLAILFTSCDRLNVATCAKPEQVSEWLKHKYTYLYYTEDNEGQTYSTF
jgi:hypothetical protein